MACRHLLFPFWALLAASAHAGGHFDVDDAGTLGPGQCQAEVWGGRFGAAPTITALHLGPSCAVGPVELDINYDHTASLGAHADFFSPALKWTFLGKEAGARISAAGYLAATYDLTHGGRTGGQFAIPLSWNMTKSLQLSFNLGYDWTPVTADRSGRGGLQADWSLTDKIDLIAERFRSFGFWTTRAGLRFQIAPLLSIDCSAARVGGADGAWGFAVGLNQQFNGL
jgi:hypothetical protein